jgi:hypothetical protein
VNDLHLHAGAVRSDIIGLLGIIVGPAKKSILRGGRAGDRLLNSP